MASVYNSRNAPYTLTDSSFTGRWEDLQTFTTVISTLQIGTDTSGTAHLQWVNTADDEVPSDYTTALVADTYTFGPSQSVTKQFDTRARWFRLNITGTGQSLEQISTLYKKAPTEIKLTDDSTNIVSVNIGDTKNSLYTILSDLSGALIGTTNDAHSGEALYTHLADGSGDSLATTDNNRDITRTLTDADVSFVFTSDGLDTGRYGNLVVDKNRFRLPKATIPFKDGDTIRFAMGALGASDFSVGGAFGTPANPAGVLKITGTVRYREVETDHVNFELLVDKNMSEWFDPNIGFTNFDPSHFVSFDDMTANSYTSAVSENSHAYLLEVSNGYVPTVDAYYAAFADPSGFNQTNGLTLNPGPYPVDLRFYRGSLAHNSTFEELATLQGYNNTDPGTNHDDISFNDGEDPISVRNIFGTVRNVGTRVRVGYDIDTTGTPVQKVGFDSDTSFFITNTFWQDTTREINDYNGKVIDVSFYAAGNTALDVSSVGLNITGGDGILGNFRVVSYDLSAAYNPLESLAVALRDNQNDNIGSTGEGTTSYYYHNTRHTNTNVLFLLDVCFVPGNEQLNDIMPGINNIVTYMNANTGATITSAVAGYNDGTPIGIDGGNVTYTAYNSILKPLDNNSDNWGSFTYNDPFSSNTATGNFWKVLNGYANQEYGDTCLGSIFTSSLDAIVLFSYADPSSSWEDRIAFDACSTFFNGIDKIAITDNNNTDITELLAFTGDLDNIYRYPRANAQDFDTCATFLNTIARRLIGIKHVGNNALKVHTADVCGHSQAGTRPIVGAEHGDVALYYALADSYGTQLDTTGSTSRETGLNAAYVSLVTKVNAQGTALQAGPSTVNTNRPLHIAFDAEFAEGKTFDFAVSGYPVTIADLSNNNVNLTHLGIANEGPTTVWLKVYDMSVGYYLENSGAEINLTTGNLDSSAYTLQSRLVYNFAVPAMDYRDFEFTKGVKFDYGIYVVASTNYRYDTYEFNPGAKQIFVHGNYIDITPTS